MSDGSGATTNQGPLSSSPNVNVTQTVVEQDVVALNCCASATKEYVTTEPEMSMTLRIMIDSGNRDR